MSPFLIVRIDTLDAFTRLRLGQLHRTTGKRRVGRDRPAGEIAKVSSPKPFGVHPRHNPWRKQQPLYKQTPTSMRADFKILDRVSVRDLPASTGGSLVVEAGKKGSELA